MNGLEPWARALKEIRGDETIIEENIVKSLSLMTISGVKSITEV